MIYCKINILNMCFFLIAGILIGKCWLHQSLSSIDDNVSQQQCLSNYRELISLDKLRKGHYEDKLKIIDEEIANNM